ncbi:hypothetical protein MKX07_001909 [Trichoderma sp. CBMAI-0711]|nr:hypothetical protein MKX07_001909 [Trichoderma sp. CBMAI-0711]
MPTCGRWGGKAIGCCGGRCGAFILGEADEDARAPGWGLPNGSEERREAALQAMRVAGRRQQGA